MLFLVYGLLIFNMVLTQKEIFTFEYSFIAFIAAAIIFLILKIDSRFLILPAILGLAYCPFLLMADQETFAESIAIYVYYFLVVGVLLQLVEFIRKKDCELCFDKVIKKVFRLNIYLGPNIVLLVATAIVWYLEYKSPLMFTLLKYNLTYLLLIVTILNIISIIIKKEFSNENFRTSRTIKLRR